MLMIFTSFIEFISIGAVLPFLGVLTNPDLVYSHNLARPIVGFIGANSPRDLVVPMAAVFVVVTVLAAIIRIAMLYVITKLSFLAGSDLSVDIYRKTLYQKYQVHASRNSSELINGLVQKINIVIYDVINSVLTIGSSVILIIGIMIAVFMVDARAALYSLVSFSVVYLIISKYTKHILNKNGQKVAKESNNIVKALQEGLGGIRDVLIDGTQKEYCDAYQTSDLQLRRAAGMNRFVAASPRYIIESIGMILIVILALLINQREGGMNEAIPLLGALALGAQRILPIAQQTFASVSSIRGAYPSLKDVLSLLDQPLPTYASMSKPSPLPFNSTIALVDVGFRFSDSSPWAVRHVNFNIKKGSIVGVIGKTGSGKSTVVDILMGLLVPLEGGVYIDGKKLDSDINRRRWQTHIAHVPQFIYLTDGTIEDNITFGMHAKEIDGERLQKSIAQACLTDLIEDYPEKLKTMVGENGVRLSGGQRQRIGIARALYKKADVLILDEATSALDNNTEKRVIEAIHSINEDLTVIMIAHRITTLKNCDQIIKVDGKTGVEILRYEDCI